MSEADSPSGMSTPSTRSGPNARRAEVRDEARVDAAREADDGAAAAEVLVDDLAQALGDLVDASARGRRGGATRRSAQPAPFEPAVFSPTKRVMFAIESRFSGRTSSSAICDLVALLDEADQLEDAGRVDHADLDQRVVGVEDDAVGAQGEVVPEELTDFLLDGVGAGHDGQREVARNLTRRPSESSSDPFGLSTRFFLPLPPVRVARIVRDMCGIAGIYARPTRPRPRSCC